MPFPVLHSKTAMRLIGHYGCGDLDNLPRIVSAGFFYYKVLILRLSIINFSASIFLTSLAHSIVSTQDKVAKS